MKLKSPQFWIVLFTVGTVLTLALVTVEPTSPGPLSAVHGRESDLEGGSGCNECHGTWRESMTEACADCHALIAEQIEAGAGLHGALGEKQAARCAVCHSEHNGPGFALVNRQSFTAAGASAEAFEHDMVGFPMDGRHLEIVCTQCHPNALDAILPRGETRYVGLEKDCSTCHADSHDGLMTIGCARCHAQTDWTELGSLGHEEHLPLIGGHAALSCQECHGEGSFRSLQALGYGGSRPTPRACIDCHASPHAEAFVQGVARMVTLAPGQSCVTCHAAEHESFDDERLQMTPALHARSGFRLESPHDQASCEDCHQSGGLWNFARRYPGREPDECSACHEDVHEGQFDQGPFAGLECIACHAYQHFEPHEFTVEKHEAAALELFGSHLESDCYDCHLVEQEGRPRVFHGTPSDCEACHEDAHETFFNRYAHRLEPVPNGDCARCHIASRFSDVPRDDFDHAWWTGFAIVGAHAQTDCETCHPRAEHPDDRGRTFGRVDEHFGAFEGCITCHIDPHEGEFDTFRHPAKVRGKAGCERCHVQSSFRAFPDGFDHGRWTGFPITGRHAEVSCTTCHASLSTPTELGRTWERAQGQECGDCHQSSHGGQFTDAGRTDCARCHKSAMSFTDLAFIHERDSRFPLGEAHAELACEACHMTVLNEGVEIVRYRPLPTACVDCHGDHEEPLLRRRGGG